MYHKTSGLSLKICIWPLSIRRLEIRADMEQRQTADFSAQKKRMAACEKRFGEFEILIAKIYEDNALGKLPDKRYEMLSCQYEFEVTLHFSSTSTENPYDKLKRIILNDSTNLKKFLNDENFPDKQ